MARNLLSIGDGITEYPILVSVSIRLKFAHQPLIKMTTNGAYLSASMGTKETNMYYLNISEDGYLLSIASTPMTGAPAIASLDGLDLSGCRMGAYHWDGHALTLDADRLAQLEESEQRQRNEEHISELKEQLSATDYAVIKIAEGSATVEEYADVIAKRREWREEINQLEGD